jgi:hypothetical protein
MSHDDGLSEFSHGQAREFAIPGGAVGHLTRMLRGFYRSFWKKPASHLPLDRRGYRRTKGDLQ